MWVLGRVHFPGFSVTIGMAHRCGWKDPISSLDGKNNQDRTNLYKMVVGLPGKKHGPIWPLKTTWILEVGEVWESNIEKKTEGI